MDNTNLILIGFDRSHARPSLTLRFNWLTYIGGIWCINSNWQLVISCGRSPAGSMYTNENLRAYIDGPSLYVEQTTVYGHCSRYDERAHTQSYARRTMKDKSM